MAAVQLSYLGNLEIPWEMQFCFCPEWQHLDLRSSQGRIFLKRSQRIFFCRCTHLSDIWTGNAWRATRGRLGVHGSKIVGLILLQWKGPLCKAGQITRFCPTQRVSQIIAKLQTNLRNPFFPERTVTNHYKIAMLFDWFLLFLLFHFSYEKLNPPPCFSKCGSKRFLVLVKLPKTLSPQWKHLMHKCTVLILVGQPAAADNIRFLLSFQVFRKKVCLMLKRQKTLYFSCRFLLSFQMFWGKTSDFVSNVIEWTFPR